eukprot:2144258-Amphidinium_carterae.1
MDYTEKSSLRRRFYTHGEDAARYYVNKINFTKLFEYVRQVLRPPLSILRLCDDWRRRPIQATLHFVQ